jgi:hypothetical protein
MGSDREESSEGGEPGGWGDKIAKGRDESWGR